MKKYLCCLLTMTMLSGCGSTETSVSNASVSEKSEESIPSDAASSQNDSSQGHVCSHVCTICGKCEDYTCDDEACTEKCECPAYEFTGAFEVEGYFTVEFLQLFYKNGKFTTYQCRVGNDATYKTEYKGKWTLLDSGEIEVNYSTEYYASAQGKDGKATFKNTYVTDSQNGTRTYSFAFDMYGYNRTALMSQKESVTDSDYEAWLELRYSGEGSGTGATSIEEYYDLQADNLVKKYADREDGEIILFGGSQFEKWKTAEEDLAPYKVQNKGVGGAGDEQFKRSVSKLVYDANPSIVFFMNSTNSYTSGKTSSQIWEEKQELLTGFKENVVANGGKIVLMSSTPNPLRYFGQYHDAMAEVDTLLKEYCDSNEGFYYLDVITPLTINGEANTAIWLDDNLHLNDDGYVLLTKVIKDCIASLSEE